MIASALLWVAAMAFGIVAIAVTAMEEEEAAKAGRNTRTGYFLTSIVLLLLALLMAHAA